ncbi:type II toxin-antitoxin system RelE/ParE family toxin [Sphingomonas aerolata]|uniref:type II toxin-antitoxin system RelE/ParE family toxin n=1 Tax=Sphingomonas aerolata TaxID=185951 RepID=UPI002FDF8A6A
MTLPLVWTDDATRDLLEIADYLVPRKFAAAQRLIAIRHAVETLPDHPRHYRVTGTSEILAILHARQRSPEAPPPPATPH